MQLSITPISNTVSNLDIFDLCTISIYTFAWISNVQIRSNISLVFINYFLIYWVISGIANLISIFLNKKNMTQISYLIIVVLWVLNGVNPSYEKLYSNINNSLMASILLLATPLNEALKIFLVEELNNYPECYNDYIDNVYKTYHISKNNNYKFYLFYYGLIFKILTIICIFFKKKFKFKK